MKKNLIILVFLTVVMIAILAFFYRSGLLSIVAGPHTVYAFNQTFLLNGGWGDTGTKCRVSSTSFAQSHLEDDSNTTIKVVGSIPNTGGSACSAYGVGFNLQLVSVDLRNYEKVVIYRQGSASAAAVQAASYEVNTFGIIDKNRVYNNQYASVSTSFGPVVITNDGASIIVKDDHGSKLYVIGNDPIHFTDDVAINGEGAPTRGGSINYEITGVELTPFPVIDNTGGSSGIGNSVTTSWWMSFWNWLKKIFTF